MLFHPSADQKLGSIAAELEVWDSEADLFRSAARAARRGEAPAAALVSAVEEAHDGLMSLLDDLDRTLGTMPAGHPDFRALLHAQTRATALLESIASSLDMLERWGAVEGPKAIPTASLLKAAE